MNVGKLLGGGVLNLLADKLINSGAGAPLLGVLGPQTLQNAKQTLGPVLNGILPGSNQHKQQQQGFMPQEPPMQMPWYGMS